uniref:Nad4L n=1 Tax=Urostyla grandis TaxID=57509 RepID=A0A2I4PEQ3_9SPIT|nr:Nad4L [Urostyla grandis]
MASISGSSVDDLTLLALPFFFLIFSAIELGLGLLLLTLQLQITRSLNPNLNRLPQASINDRVEPFYRFK